MAKVFYNYNMKHRYYLGLQLPSDICTLIADTQSNLFDPVESIEPLEPHITLLPPPAVEDIAPSELAIHARAAAQALLPLQLTLSKVITFRGHAVAIEVEGQPIYELQQRLVSLLPYESDISYAPEATFHPHVTLVQALRGRTLPVKLIQEYTDWITPELPITFTVEHLTIFEWTGPRRYHARPL
jgi:2'-5' RNA ligase